MDLKEKARNLPSVPGVYLMKDSLGGIIYVGKSKNLKNRVGSYFRSSGSHPAKVEKLIKNLKDFEYIPTDTEFEAFMLECKLIKELKPIYNKKMKNPLSYTYIKIALDKEYPIIETTNSSVKNDTDLYFGPYTNKNTVERAIQGIKECCKIICTNQFRKCTACLNYSLGLCIGMCLGDSASEQYHSIINKVIGLLDGTDKSILEEMKENMLVASEEFDFETAAKYRDYIEAVNFLINKGKTIKFTEENKNIVMTEPLSDYAIKLFLIKRNKVLFSETYKIEDRYVEQLSKVIKANIMTYFKTASLNSSIEVTRDEIDEAQIIYSYLKNSGCSHIIIPENCLHSMNNTILDKLLNKLLCSLSKST